MASTKDHPLLILDLDETLIHAVDDPLEFSPDFSVERYLVYQRPYVMEFLTICATVFDIAVWSSGSSKYVNAIVDALFPEEKPVFIWSRDRCAERRDPETDSTFFKKDLKKVARRGYSLSRTVIVEDDPRNVLGQYGNAVYIKPFRGNPKDNELEKLLPLLLKLANSSDIRSIDKGIWGLTRLAGRSYD